MNSSMELKMRIAVSRKNRTIPQKKIMNIDTGVGLIGRAISHSFLQAEFKDELV